MLEQSRLARSEQHLIAGVCGGIAEFVGWSPSAVRALYVLASVASAAFPGIIVYLVLWWVMPPPSASDRLRLEDFQRQ